MKSPTILSDAGKRRLLISDAGKRRLLMPFPDAWKRQLLISDAWKRQLLIGGSNHYANERLRLSRRKVLAFGSKGSCIPSEASAPPCRATALGADASQRQEGIMRLGDADGRPRQGRFSLSDFYPGVLRTPRLLRGDRVAVIKWGKLTGRIIQTNVLVKCSGRRFQSKLLVEDFGRIIQSIIPVFFFIFLQK